MAKKTNLKGKIFGRWTVISESDKRGKNGEILWNCRCICGNEKIVIAGNLRSGTSTSCGCFFKEMVSSNKTKSIQSGATFGELTVIRRSGSTNWKGNKEALYICLCSCGKSTLVSSSNLRTGNTKTCGHRRKELVEIMNNKENIKKKVSTRRETDWVDNNSLSSISPQRKKSTGKTSSVIGVSKEKKTGKWKAQLMVKGTLVLSARFDNEEDAKAARKKAEDKYFKPILDKYEKEGDYDQQ